MTKPEINGNGNPASVHLVLQGKGGVGKSFVSAILAQYFRTKSAPVHCLDTDPVNATFAQYRLLEADYLKVLRRGTINEKQFDLLVERVCQGDGVFIVDTGATTFVPVWNYILENESLDFFNSHGRRVFVHSVVTGGQAMTDTFSGLERLAQTTSERNVVVWLNEYFGEVIKDGKTFEEFKVAEEYAPKLVGTVVIRESVSKVPEDHTAVVCTSAASSTSGFVTVVLVPRSSFPNGTDAANDDARPPVNRLLAEKSYMLQIVFMTSPTAVLMKSGKD